jgi:photosystem II stability/assembly factor-like uncharacterized protein
LGALAVGSLVVAGKATAAAWRPLGPEGGTVSLLRFAHADPRLVYAATRAGLSSLFFFGSPPAGGRIFRSADGGATWSAASQGLPNLAVLSLAIDPVRSTVAYVGNAAGLWRTADGGGGWSPVYGPLAGQAVTALAIDPAHPATIYAGTAYTGDPDQATSGRVFRSDDGGHSWALHSRGLAAPHWPNTVVALAVDTTSPGSVVAILNNFPACGSFWKSANRGLDWHQANGPSFSFCPDSSGIQQDPISGTLYASTPDPDGTLLSSVDSGENWRVSYYQPAAVVVSASGKLYGVFAVGGYHVGFPSRFIHASSDGGLSWEVVGRAPGAIELLAVDPTASERLLAGAVRRGLFRTSDGGATWSGANSGLVATVITQVTVDSQPPGSVYVGTAEDGVLMSADGGEHWQAIGPPPWEGWDPVDGDSTPNQVHALALRGHELWASIDGGPEQRSGNSWTLLSGVDCGLITALAPDPTSESVYAIAVYLTIRDCELLCPLLESRDGGLDWSCPQQDFSWASAVSVDPADPAVVYGLIAGDSSSTQVSTQVWKSTNHGGTFQSSSLGLGKESVTSFAVSPVDHDVLWAGTGSGKVFKSIDQGVSWFRVDRDLPDGIVVAVVPDPRDPDVAFAEVQGAGVFRTGNGGAQWRPLPGLPTELLDGTLAIGGTDGQRLLYAGTSGAGLFALPIP